MKKLLYFAVGVMCSFMPIYAEIAPVTSDNVVAKVNGEVIKKVELERAIDVLVPRTFFHAGVTDEKRDGLKDEALDKLIDKKLILQYAIKSGIKVSKSEIDEQEKRIRKPFRDKKSFLASLKKARFDYESFRNALEVDLIMDKFYKKEIKASFTEEELKEYYKKNKFKFKEPEKVRVRLIYIRNDPTDPKGKQKARKKVDEAYKKIKEGSNFADIATEYSDAMSRIKGGDMGYIHKGMLEPDVDNVVYKLESGQMSEIIENDRGFYLAYVEEKKPQRLISFEATKGKLEKELIATTENKREDKLLEKLKLVADIQR